MCGVVASARLLLRLLLSRQERFLEVDQVLLDPTQALPELVEGRAEGRLLGRLGLALRAVRLLVHVVWCLAANVPIDPKPTGSSTWRQLPAAACPAERQAG